MQKKEQGTGLPSDKAKKVATGKIEPVTQNDSDLAPKAIPDPTMRVVEKEPSFAVAEEPVPLQSGYPLMPPSASILNGSGFVTLQMFRKGTYMTKNGLFVPGSGYLDMAERYKSPIPNDAVWFVVDYDLDINLKYRKEKLKLYGYDEKNKNHIPSIKRLDEIGDLDILRIGDEIIMNGENFIPVKMKLELDTYYRVHTMDIMAIKKHYPRMAFEQPESEKEKVEKKKLMN